MSKHENKPAKTADVKQADKSAETAKTQAAPAEPTSEKLEQLKKDKAAAMTAAATAQIAGDEKGAEDKFLEVYKIGEDIKRELAAIRQHEVELLKKEKEAAIVKLNDDQIAAYDNHLKVAASNASMDDKNAAYNAFKAAREAVVNRLLGSRPVVKSEGKSATGVKGAASSEIEAEMEAGKTYDEMIASGHKDGTIRSVAWKAGFSKNADGTYTRKVA